ncbi:MAG: AMP-binding protein [Erysipelotrichaceae bacterium]|nr:AMP-binding protein [Erysipelotrichaceae bacterium]
MITNNIKTPWYKYYGKMRQHLDYPNHSLYRQLYETIKKHPNLTALNYYGNKITYKQLCDQIDITANALYKQGIRTNDVVTICMPNTPEAVYAFYALNKLGAIANMIHPLSAENEIKYYLNISESKMVIAIDLAWPKINTVINDSMVKKTVLVSVKTSMPLHLKLGYTLTKGRKIKHYPTTESLLYWSELINSKDKTITDIEADNDGSAYAAILYSGGTTGYPKGIILSNLNFNALALQGIEACGNLELGDKLLSIMPIFHGFGLGICIHTALCFGGEAVILPQFSAKTFDKLISKYQPNIIAGVPTLYEAMMMNQKIAKMDLSCIKCAISGGDSLSVSLKRKVDAFFKDHNANVEIREGYGLTECVTGSCLTPIDYYREGSIGIPYPDTYYKIVKPHTETEAAYNEEGEIVISGPTVMVGYLKEEKETNQTIRKHDDGLLWLHTGDLGYMDEDGFVYFKQRLKRMIVSSGYNVYPQYIENIIDSHPDVLMSTVIGVDHPYKKQVAKAFVVPNLNIAPSEELKKEIYALCEKNLAKYSIPYEIEFREALPKTLVGKVAYTVLAEEERNKQTTS